MSVAAQIDPPFAAVSAEPLNAERHGRVEALFGRYEGRVFAQTNQLFWWLLVSQWAFAIFVAAVWSPRAWAGTENSIHPHLLAAIFGGGLLVSAPLLLMRWLPHHAFTRHAVAVAQVSFSALLIHLTGGRLETHFHVFGSLAFLALYRDWRVLVTATIVVALDHLLRGLWFPESVYGVPFATVWRTLEHAGWVVFEDVVLLWACAVSRREMREICRREDQNQQLLADLELRVIERTAALEAEVGEHERTARELRHSEERFRTLILNVPIGIFETTRAGEVRLANPHLLQILGLPPHQDLSQLSMTSGQIFSIAERARFWLRLETEGGLRGYEVTVTRADGRPIDVVVNARLKPPSAGVPLSCEGTIEDVTDRKRAARALETLHQQLVVASRQAGMADVATGVLHNIGNVLTSVNVTVHDVLDRLRASRLSHLHRVVETLQRERPRLATFLADDPAGRALPEFLAKLDTHLAEENQRLVTDVEALVQHFTHISEIVVSQQSAAQLVGVNENLPPAQLIGDALSLTAASFARHGITLEEDFAEVPAVRADRHKVLQILVNLFKNAKDSVLAAAVTPARINVRIAPAGVRHIALAIADNGLGITPENLSRIFQHGFTTKPDGHGFGLHSSVLAAREMGGDLEVTSDGPGRGATFILTLPVAGAAAS